MTEIEWLACTDPTPMLDFLRGKASDRKLPLFSVACCRHIWNLMTDKRSRAAVELAERHADVPVSEQEIDVAWDESQDATADAENAAPDDDFTVYANHAAYSTIPNPLDLPAFYHARATAEYSWWAVSGKNRRERSWQCCLLREIVGDPFRPEPAEVSWLARNDATIPKVAQSIYEKRAFDRLPILADALQEAGCDDEEILAHCRQPGSHVRGCWAVDLVLGKE